MGTDIQKYFVWSINALMPTDPHYADIYLTNHREAIKRAADNLLHEINFIPATIYRGILLKEKVETIKPHNNFKYLSFSESKEVAEHFANVNGFGSDIVNLQTQLGTHGYIIEYKPELTEVIFHYRFLSILPYANAFNSVGLDANKELEGLERQKEITIFQPAHPFTKVKKLSVKTFTGIV